MRGFCFAVAGCFATALLTLAGCSSSAADTKGPDDQGADVGQPPKAGPDKAGDGPGVVLAVNKLFLGETDRKGNPAPNDGWKQFGFNIDGKVTTTASRDVCKPVQGAKPSDVYPDGDDGIDNSFGKNLLGLISNIVSSPSTEVSDAISKGDFTLMLHIDKLGTGTEYNPLTAKFYAGAKRGMPPVWDGNDKWPVLRELLTNPTDIESTKVVFPESYVVDNTWVSGGKGSFTLSITIKGQPVTLTINSAIVTMQLDEDHKGAVNGTIAGVLETSVLEGELENVIGAIQPDFCGSTTIQTILQAVHQASDIMKDGTQDPTKTCDGISIGIGFTAKQVQLGDIAPPATPAAKACQGMQPGN